MDELFRTDQSCRQKFANLVALTESPIRDFSTQVSRRDWDIEIERYKIWANGVGVGYSGENYESSLDYRLRDASFLRYQVALILKLLSEHIENAIVLLKGERVPWEDLTRESTEPENPKDDTQDTKPPQSESDDDTEEDSPWDFSSDDVSTNGDSPDDYVGGNDISRRSTVSGIVNIHGPNARTRTDFPAGEMAQIRHAIQTTISSLYALPTRKAVIQDRLRGELPEEVTSFEDLDILYVKDKFPELAKSSPEVATRLGKLMTRRREILHSRKNRGSRQLQPSVSTMLKPTGHLEGPIKGLRNSGLFEPLEYTPLVPSTLASALLPEDLEVAVPRRPLGENGEELETFVCPYCCTVQEIKWEREWRAHVLQDLQPYVCTYPDCELGDFLFESREQWYQHELAKHRVNWFCNTKGHGHCNNKTDFSAHMAAEHDNDDFHFSGIDPLVAFKLFSIPGNATEPGFCTLCMTETSDPESHVGRHLETIALAVIRPEDIPKEPRGETPRINRRGKIKMTEGKQSRGIADPFSRGDKRLYTLSDAESERSLNKPLHIVFRDAIGSNKAPADENKTFTTNRGFEKRPNRKGGIKVPKNSFNALDYTSSSESDSDSDSSSITSSVSDMAFGTPPRWATFGSDTYTTPPSSFSELHLKLKSWARRNISSDRRTSKQNPSRRLFSYAKSDGPSSSVERSKRTLKRRESFDFNMAFSDPSSDSSTGRKQGFLRSKHREEELPGQSKSNELTPKPEASTQPPVSTGKKRRSGKRESVDSNLAFGGSSSEASASDYMRKSRDQVVKKVWRWWRTGTADTADIDPEDHGYLKPEPDKVS
ncbi:hypothetical protein EYR41_008921 [Orbilia oligospora]|uniref:Oxidoreductase acuF-like C2H2 type zinc-finger domain-containing protein n=2 Tax=Orbilia oligospora TaxID=2813651 RepID=A0A7C8KIB3_ORBOL|nr:hypothetical protein TWF751_003957 [Orbilia oligospora]TGJ64914.1 hypothetical protein EYR41_008921 [Orbilia oligospora]